MGESVAKRHPISDRDASHVGIAGLDPSIHAASGVQKLNRIVPRPQIVR